MYDPLYSHRANLDKLARFFSPSYLGSNKGELSCIFALINDDNAEFNLRVDHGLHKLVRDWLLDSTAPDL